MGTETHRVDDAAAPRITLVLGGARSGKSAVAEQLAVPHALAAGRVMTYLATGAPASDDDPERAGRVAEHRARRPPTWRTVELGAGGDLVTALAERRGPVLVDSLGGWVAGTPDFLVDVAALCGILAARARRADASILVSDEIGLALQPTTAAGRAFRDALGALNRAVSDVADRAVLVVAGRILDLPAIPPAAPPPDA